MLIALEDEASVDTAISLEAAWISLLLDVCLPLRIRGIVISQRRQEIFSFPVVSQKAYMVWSLSRGLLLAHGLSEPLRLPPLSLQ